MIGNHFIKLTTLSGVEIRTNVAHIVVYLYDEDEDAVALVYNDGSKIHVKEALEEIDRMMVMAIRREK